MASESQYCHFSSFYADIVKATKKHKKKSVLLKWKKATHMAIEPDTAVQWANNTINESYHAFYDEHTPDDDERIMPLPYFEFPFETFTLSVTNEQIGYKEIIFLIEPAKDNVIKVLPNFYHNGQWNAYAVPLLFIPDKANALMEQHCPEETVVALALTKMGIEPSGEDVQRVFDQYAHISSIFLASMYLINAPTHYEQVNLKTPRYQKRAGLKAKRAAEKERGLKRKLIKLRKPEIKKRYPVNPETVGTGKKQIPHTRRAHTRRYKSGKVVEVASYAVNQGKKNKPVAPANNYEISTRKTN